MDPTLDFIEITTPLGIVERQAASGHRMLIGRTDACQVHLDCPTVSRQHAELVFGADGRWWIKDLGSRNGTMLNGQLIDQAPLGPVDVVQIESYQLQIRPAASTRPSAADSMLAVTLAEPGGAGGAHSDAGLRRPQVDTEQVETLFRFGRQLLQTAHATDRLTALCQLMTTPAFGGESAMVVRLAREASSASTPEILCQPVTAEDGPPATGVYLSPALIRQVRSTLESAVAARGTRRMPDPNDPSGPGATPITAAALPLRIEDSFLDLLYLSFPRRQEPAETLTLARLAVEQLQLTELAWAGRQQAGEQAAMAAELERARQLQRSCIPTTVALPGVDAAIGFEPCPWVGGDYGDALPVGPDRHLLLVADVSGKGLDAALVTVRLHAFLHTHARPGLSLRDLTEALNDHLTGTLSERAFVSALLMLYTPATGEVEMANCGHPPALLSSPGQAPVTLGGGMNMPLGCFAPMVCQIEKAILQPGQVLLAYNDGLAEMPPSLDGIAGCLAMLHRADPTVDAATLATRLNQQLDDKQAGRLPEDDRCFLVLKQR